MQKLVMLLFLVLDYQFGIDFYCNVLGFDLCEDIDFGDGKCWVVVVLMGVDIVFVLVKVVGLDQIVVIGNQGGGCVWLFLQIDDFVWDYEMMLKNGILFEEIFCYEFYGMVVVWCDFFGNWWDLIEFSCQLVLFKWFKFGKIEELMFLKFILVEMVVQVCNWI